MVISYRWASDMVYKVTGSPPPAAGAGPAAMGGSPVEVPPPGARPLGYEVLVAAVRKEMPNWEQISIRFGGPAPRSGGGAERPRAEGASRGERNGESRNAPQPVSIAVRELNGWPLFASVQLSLDPFTGAVLKKESYADYNTGRKVRTWMRFLHTGEAFGFVGKLVATVASLGGAVLVWTGLTLACRRFIAWRRKPVAEVPVVETSEEVPVP